MENNLPDEPILRRAYLFLEDGDWENAYAYADRALDAAPENYRAYVCKLLCELRTTKEELLKCAVVDFGKSINYKNAVKFADSEQLEFLQYSLECAKKNQATLLAAKLKADEKEAQISDLENKIKKAEKDIGYYHETLSDIEENKKKKIVAGLYLAFFLFLPVGIPLAICLHFEILLPICIPLGVIGMVTLHSIMCYIDEIVDSKFLAIGLGFINIWSLGIWGIVKSIKILVSKASYFSKSELNDMINDSNKKIAQLKKDLEILKASR